MAGHIIRPDQCGHAQRVPLVAIALGASARARERGGYREPATMRVAEPVKEKEWASAAELGPMELDVADVHPMTAGGDGLA